MPLMNFSKRFLICNNVLAVRAPKT